MSKDKEQNGNNGSAENPENENEEGEVGTPFTEIPIRYGGQSQMIVEEGTSQLALFGNLNRDPVFLDGTVKDPIRLREALAAMYAVVGSDYRYVPKDRTKYNAYRRMKKESANFNAWQAQHAYFEWLAQNDPLAFCILDPVISVHPEQVFMEVFSRDEGSYANLSVDMDAFELSSEPVCGTTNIDFSESLIESVMQFRSYRETRLTIGQEAVEVKTEGTPDVLEKQVRIPDSWLRGFLQVQSSAMLPTDSFSLSPMDMYNILRQLRTKADQKGKRRGLRIELIPNEHPRIVLEPWETVIETSAAKYEGKQPKVVRVWGRRRLMMLKRMLPFIEEVEVHLVGSGLPSFWVLKAGPMKFTLGITGFTASNWSQSIDFDLMLPRKVQESKPLEKIVKHLAKEWSDDRAGLTKATKLTGEDLIEQVQLGCQYGQIMYDVGNERFRLRPLTAEPLELDRLEFRNPQERIAHDLLHRKNAVTISSENRIHGTGLELTGKAVVEEDKRDYRPQMLLSDEGFVSRAECTCTTFRKQGLKAGPCAHLVALRLAYAKLQRDRKAGKDKSSISVETRAFSRRKGSTEQVYQVSLDKKRLKVIWGNTGSPMRSQQLQFQSVDSAREEYFLRVNNLVAKGYLDASG